MERRLAAILAADMVGYSRLMDEDEAGTLAAYRRHRRELFNPKAAQYRGRIIKLTGDGALMEFVSVADAVAFAVEVQLALRDRNAGVPEKRQFRYRIGIHIGDVVVEEEDIYGSGVNLTARLEGLADPGGICISEAVFDQVKGNLDLGFEPLGEKRVKNIAEPVSIYRVVLDERAAALVTPVVQPSSLQPGRMRLGAAAAALLVLLAGGLFLWQPWQPAPGPVPQRFAYPLPDKPSIAVLPFINVGGEDDQDHFAAGLTDDLITELSKVSGLFVIARHSVFALKDTAGRIQDVAAELGVRYVLEGSLRRAGPRIRVNVKLIDALSGLSLWAERYDRNYADLFALQDDLIEKIIAALAIQLTEDEKEKLARIPTDNLEAYDYYLRAEQEGFYYSDVETYRRALSYYQRAIDLDPDFAEAHAGIARIAVDVWHNHYTFLWSGAVARKIAYDAAGQALRLDPDSARAHIVLALLQLVDGRPVEAQASARTALAAEPNHAETLGNASLIFVHTGARTEALAGLEKALRLDPAPPSSLRLLAGVIFYIAEDYDRALPLLEAARDGLPMAEPAREYLAATYAYAEEGAEAKLEVAALRELFPETNLEHYRSLYGYWRRADLDHHLEGLRKAGITTWPFGFEGRKEDRLNGAELRAVTSGLTWIGRQHNGTGFQKFFDQAGNLAYRSSNSFITGTARIRGDRLCQRFEGHFLDRETCGYVYRHSQSSGAEAGDAAKKPPAGYAHVSPLVLEYFKLEE